MMKRSMKKGFYFLLIFLNLITIYYGQIQDWSDLFEKNKSSVVSITVIGESKDSVKSTTPPNSPFDFFFEKTPRKNSPKQQISGSGSGFILEKEGYILTNTHVIKGAENITVHLSDQREFPAKLVGSDEKSDIAIIKIEAKDLPTVKIGNIDSLKVGQPVLAVGSPFGLSYTATQGIISSLGRNLPRDSYTPFIQTDAAVNPGNSGGPLFNVKGEVIGITSQIYSRTGSYAGVSFAIPIDLAMDVVKQLKEKGKVSRGWLGVTIQQITPELADSYKMEKPYGALVSDIVKNGPADKSQLKIGDVILELNSKEIPQSSALPIFVGRLPEGTKAQLTVLRDSKKIKINVVIGQLPDRLDEITMSSEIDRTNGYSINKKLGIEIADLSEVQKNSEKNGVIIINVKDGLAYKAGLRQNDIIRQINGVSVKNIKEFNIAIEETKKDKVIRLLIQRNNQSLFVGVRIN